MRNQSLTKDQRKRTRKIVFLPSKEKSALASLGVQHESFSAQILKRPFVDEVVTLFTIRSCYTIV